MTPLSLESSQPRRAPRRLGVALLVFALGLIAVPLASAASPVLVQGTTDIRDAGLLEEVIEPGFHAAYPQYELKYIPVGTGQALTNEGEVSLSDKELRLMEVFAANENRALTRTDLLEEVWGMDQFPTDRTVDNFILRLRKLFEPDPENPVHIVTLRGRGYLFRSAP